MNKGELISILGHNGSGKSTLAKLLNAQITPTDGEIEIYQKLYCFFIAQIMI